MEDAAGGENFVQVPHWVMDYLMTAKLNMTQFRIVQVVIRNTFGFHRTWNQFSLTFLSEKTDCHKRQVTRELGMLIDSKVLVERYDKGKRVLRINPKLKSKESNTSPHTESGSDSLDTTRGDSLDTRGSDSLDTHIKKEIKEKEDKEKYYIDLPIDDHVFLKIYNSEFKRALKKEHPKITEQQLLDIIHHMELLQEWEITGEEFKEQVRDHFETLPKKNNGSILAFIPSFMRRFEVPYTGFVD
ncbi:hypothetical protein BSK54_10375 [Paenibacillus odorifer]|uniref:replication protein n=1 Tax=Paenibacillus odorifer TaxID=189426 RepID=UPI00096DB5D8|nr:replication protein [Paenibacillus odorifer]OME02655.1 hypothetical protein BSK54_10375 [Paenibacillus odorifer]